MSFKTMVLEPLPMANFKEMATTIKNGHSGHKVPVVTTEKGKFYACPAMDFGDFGETAIVLREPNGNCFVVESITSAWIKTDTELEKYFTDATVEPYAIKSPVTLIFGQPTGKEFAHFTCACCGEGFKGNVKEQLAHDQDSGYGLCPQCS